MKEIPLSVIPNEFKRGSIIHESKGKRYLYGQPQLAGSIHRYAYGDTLAEAMGNFYNNKNLKLVASFPDVYIDLGVDV